MTPARSATTENTFQIRVRDYDDDWNQHVKVIRGDKREDDVKFRHGREKIIHITAKDFHKAMEKAQDAGYSVISAQKVDEAVAGNRRFLGEWLGSVIGISLPPEPRHSALALDEIAFRRARRIKNNLEKDKEYIDKDG